MAHSLRQWNIGPGTMRASVAFNANKKGQVDEKREIPSLARHGDGSAHDRRYSAPSGTTQPDPLSAGTRILHGERAEFRPLPLRRVQQGPVSGGDVRPRARPAAARVAQ